MVTSYMIECRSNVQRNKTTSNVNKITINVWYITAYEDAKEGFYAKPSFDTRHTF